MRLAFVAIALAFGSPAYGQAVGAEAYLYGQIPIPPQAIAENYIEQVILPGLPPELGPLWLEAKEPGQSLDAAIDTYFSSRQSAPAPELRMRPNTNGNASTHIGVTATAAEIRLQNATRYLVASSPLRCRYCTYRYSSTPLRPSGRITVRPIRSGLRLFACVERRDLRVLTPSPTNWVSS